MIRIGIYLLAWLLVTSVGLAVIPLKGLISPDSPIYLPTLCCLVGALGGTTYCLRGLYLHVSVEGDWDDKWRTWYVVRPIVSTIMGGVSFIFLSAGLLLLEANQQPEASRMGFLALAFVAGLNVDGIIARIEQVAESTWGIRRSRASRADRD